MFVFVTIPDPTARGSGVMSWQIFEKISFQKFEEGEEI
jgi:hypothetical protein